MEFYDRTEEIATLHNIGKRSVENAQFMVVTGRRRIGKTSLVLKAKPLYNRQNRFMNIKAFTPSVLKEIMNDNTPGYSKDDLLALYSLTGGVAKYVQMMRLQTKYNMLMMKQDKSFMERLVKLRHITAL